MRHTHLIICDGTCSSGKFTTPALLTRLRDCDFTGQAAIATNGIGYDEDAENMWPS